MRKILPILFAAAVLAAFSACAPQKPVIGISTGYSNGRAAVNDTYIIAVRKAGGIPVLLPPVDSRARAREALSAVSALILTGGEDVDPARYGQEPFNETVQVNASRDTSDFLLAHAALAAGKPILGICRGEQLLNVALGGTLWQDLPSQLPGEVRHRQDTVARVGTHIVRFEPGSRISKLLQLDSAMVNSFHHQAVRDPAPGVKVSARADDGVVEAWEKGRTICVQFHPEAFIKAGDDTFLPLFEDLVKRARK